MRLTPHTPTEVKTISLPNGGVSVDVFVPTYEGGTTFSITVERDADGDWQVFLPNVEQYEVSAGVVFLGAPDGKIERVTQ